MKIYLVDDNTFYEGHKTVKAFTSEEKANEFVKLCKDYDETYPR